MWELAREDGGDMWKLRDAIEAETPPEPPKLVWKAYGRTGEGKVRALDSARSCAVWPEATDEELMADDIKDRLEARLPKLKEDFKADMVALGFVWPEGV
jgi:hypothetical protein